MNLHNLKPIENSITKKKRRVGRGQGSGKGGTSTKGHKGAQSRSGYKTKPNFEGGQMPIHMRLPKFGFKNPNKNIFKPINLIILQRLFDKKKIVDFEISTFIDNGLLSKNELAKILAVGDLKAKINVTTHSISKSAKQTIEDLGGKVTLLTTKK